MSTLLLRLAGPMQSWGTQSRFTHRDTGLEPSKSGVVGLLCAALGRPRSDPVDDLASLRMGVRVDREGVVKVDYQTAGGTHRRDETYGVYKADGGSPGTVTSQRYYLADADFLVGLEGGDGLLVGLQTALTRPVWQIYLGRKSFVPAVPLYLPDGLQRGMSLELALTQYYWPRLGVKTPPATRRPDTLRIVLEDHDGDEVRYDQPVGAAFQSRQFAPRRVKTSFLILGAQLPVREDEHVPLKTRS